MQISYFSKKFVAMNLKKLFHLQTAEQKVSEYRELLRRSER